MSENRPPREEKQEAVAIRPQIKRQMPRKMRVVLFFVVGACVLGFVAWNKGYFKKMPPFVPVETREKTEKALEPVKKKVESVLPVPDVEEKEPELVFPYTVILAKPLPFFSTQDGKSKRAIGHFSEGTVVRVLEHNGNTAFVHGNGLSGWVDIKRVPPPVGKPQ